MAGKFSIRSKKWDIGILIGSVALLVLGFGGLFLLQASGNSAGGTTMLFVVLLGIITFGFFAGPGLVYVLRKRNKRVKAALPGGTMTWIRSHLYLPILALIAAFVHASVVPFRGHLSSGKTLFVLGVLVSVAGLARHHLIGIQKAAINVNVAIGKLTTGQPRAFRRLVADYTDHRKPIGEIDAAMAEFDPKLQQQWAKIKEISTEVEKHFPREGGQKWHMRQYKLWRALHPPLTIALFVVLGFHVWDVFNGPRTLLGDETEQFAASSECAGCHSEIFDEWATSTMSHAQTSTITEGQLPITLTENLRFIDAIGETEELAVLTGRDLEEDSQEEFVTRIAAVCINCHAPIGAGFIDDDNPLALLPFSDEGTDVLGEDGVAVSGGNAAVQSDGVGCITCHSQFEAPIELQGAADLLGGTVQAVGSDYGTVFGPPFEDPNPLPTRIHGIETPSDSGFWTNDIETSQLCGACHNVKVDIDGDGLTGLDESEFDDLDIVEIIEAIEDGEDLDADDDFQLDENEVDDNRINTIGGTAINEDGGDGKIDDLVLQTTFDEWEDYVAFFDAEGGFDDRSADTEFPNELDEPLGCNGCHMPVEDGIDGGPVVDFAPGLLPIPDRFNRRHTFVGVDYDLDPELYRKNGFSDEEIAEIVAERDALIQSAVSLEVENGEVFDGGDFGFEMPVDVTIRNNLLPHAMPTGFAFARQFWVEITAELDGDEICLSPAFLDANGNPAVNDPCGSGMGDIDGRDAIEGDVELRQCDVRDVAAVLGINPDNALANGGLDETTGITLQNLDIVFAPGAAFPASECDPWLVNFQKILTDGGAVGIEEGDGLRREVPFQPLLPDAVQIRGRVATGEKLFELQPVRLRNDEDADALTVQYFFNVPEGTNPDDVEVTARIRFRHLPPYFVRDLEARQEELGDDIPVNARINSDDLRHMVVGEVVTASSGEGEQIGCEGPQNGDGDPVEAAAENSIMECIDEALLESVAEQLSLDEGDDEESVGQGESAAGPGFATVTSSSGIVPDGRLLLLFGGLALAFVVPFARVRRRR